ncbi:MAG: ABC transporter ATP-binding protein [Candidatus Promineifilaceae bacterium]|jgi:iron complex transport system ATP-binding protein
MILNVQGLRFSYPGRPVLDEASFAVEKGEILAILGTNGTGKTTLLKCINRILAPAAGAVWLDEEAVHTLSPRALAQKMGYVEQQRSGSQATVFNTVLLGRKPYIRWDVTQQDMAIAGQALETLGLTDYALRRLDELSGGELQKVIIARALAQQPQILLMDEPTSSLDLKNQLEVLALIRQISRERGIAAVVAMHDLNLALRFADRFILLKDRTIYAAGGQEVMTPENIEAVYAVPVTIASHNGSRVIIPL